MGLGDSTPRRCNRFSPKELGSRGVVIVTDLVSIHLNDLDRGENLVLKQMINLQVGVEGGPIGVESDSPTIGNVDVACSCLCSS